MPREDFLSTFPRSQGKKTLSKLGISTTGVTRAGPRNAAIVFRAAVPRHCGTVWKNPENVYVITVRFEQFLVTPPTAE